MHDKIISLTPDSIKEFKERKILQENRPDIKLDKVQKGETVVGKLSVEEIKVFLEMAAVFDEIEEEVNEFHARLLEMGASSFRLSKEELRDARTNQRFSNEIKNLYSPEELYSFFERRARADYLKAILWYNFQHRTKTFAKDLSLRAGYQVVSEGDKDTTDIMASMIL